MSGLLSNDYRWKKWVATQSYDGKTFRGARVARVLAGGRHRAAEHFILMLDDDAVPDVVAGWLKKAFWTVLDVHTFVVESDVGPVLAYARTLEGNGALVDELTALGPLPAPSSGVSLGPFSAQAQVIREYSLFGYRAVVSRDPEQVEVVGLLLGTSADVMIPAAEHVGRLAALVGARHSAPTLFETGWARPIETQVIFRMPARKVESHELA